MYVLRRFIELKDRSMMLQACKRYTSNDDDDGDDDGDDDADDNDDDDDGGGHVGLKLENSSEIKSCELNIIKRTAVQISTTETNSANQINLCSGSEK
ncbi:hypothetical protein DPMN_023512 [Dreissena polymorpha]|uniref:Uncharacterized protein n=1 Tax=Dreissena polymorpha TaxID=45954 RepID=A0A9D4LKV5_DREPO|nr:hypothetical protein DPMN_023512 [Dreissena polymorpha]